MKAKGCCEAGELGTERLTCFCSLVRVLGYSEGWCKQFSDVTQLEVCSGQELHFINHCTPRGSQNTCGLCGSENSHFELHQARLPRSGLPGVRARPHWVPGASTCQGHTAASARLPQRVHGFHVLLFVYLTFN